MEGIPLPPPETATVDVDVGDPAELSRRAIEDGTAPHAAPDLLRYLVYLGTAYLEAERVGTKAPGHAYEELHRLLGQAGATSSVLRFRYAESAREYAAESRASASKARFVGTYELLTERLVAEIGTREERVRNLERALEA